MKLSFLQNLPIDSQSFGEPMTPNRFNRAQWFGLDCDAFVMRTCIRLGFVRQSSSPEPLISSLNYLNSPDYGLLILPPAGQQKAVIHADGI